MGKRLNGPMGPIKGGGGLPPWTWRQGWGPPPPLAGALPPPPWEFSPTWGRGGGWHPPLESAPGLEFSTIGQAVVLLESGSVAVFLPLLAWFGAREERRLYRTCIISSRHYTCGATSSLEVYRESSSPVVVFYTTGRS